MLYVRRPVPPPNLQYVGQSKQVLSVGFEAVRSGRRLAGQQGHTIQQHWHFCQTAYTQRKDGALLTSLLAVIPLPLIRTICACQLLSFPAHTWDDPEAFLWVYEGLAVACGQPEEEAGREQPSSDCRPGATLYPPSPGLERSAG